MIISAIIATVISIFIIVLLEYLNNKVKTVDDVEKTIKIPVLGIVSDFEITKKKKIFRKKKKV